MHYDLNIPFPVTEAVGRPEASKGLLDRLTTTTWIIQSIKSFCYCGIIYQFCRLEV
jgi:hypothetical protein